MRNAFLAALLCAVVACSAAPARCEDPDQGWRTFGVRGGFLAIHRSEEFHQYEIFAVYGTPWSVRNAAGWGIALQGNTAVGVLHTANDNSFIGSLGPGVIIDKMGMRGVAFLFGGDLCFLNNYHLGNVDFNGNPLFQGHLGVAYRFAAGPGISYRFQHMSNGGLGRNGPGNTGLDMHMFGVGWNF